ncbi:MAG: glutamate--cysteine ligase [Pseudomonadales bacterium]
MSNTLERRLQQLKGDAAASLKNITRGIEKESLRVTPEGQLAQTEHPASLGAALCNPYITTDYSEALLEFITPAYQQPEQPLAMLEDIHRFTYSQLDNELLWTASMPCVLNRDEDIPVARYGDSNIGTMKTAYRIGLGHRYGRAMQTIAGIHYNFSLPEAFWPYWAEGEQLAEDTASIKTTAYFSLIRNFHRYSWLLLYLFGASPAVCKTFLQGRDHQLQNHGNGTLYLPYATALRMGNLGYSSSAQDSLVVCYNQLDTYISTLRSALTETHQDYDKIGLKDEVGNYKQLSTGLLQIENEFYSTVRPKRVTEAGETPIHALEQKGIEYVEIRLLDINPFLPMGMDQTEIDFMDCFLIYCLLEDSPQFDPQTVHNNQNNLTLTVNQGRDPQLTLTKSDEQILLHDWGSQILEAMKPVADMLDKTNNNTCYSNALSAQQAKIADSELTPSAQVLNELNETNSSYYHFALKQSRSHASYFASQQLSPEKMAEFELAAGQSHQHQAEIKQGDGVGFDEFLAQYYSQYDNK